MAAIETAILLASGARLPTLGLGVYQTLDPGRTDWSAFGGARPGPHPTTAASLATWRFDDGLAANTTFAGLLTHWYRIIDTHGLDGLRNEINNG